jgi:hypothetical protein
MITETPRDVCLSVRSVCLRMSFLNRFLHNKALDDVKGDEKYFGFENVSVLMLVW